MVWVGIYLLIVFSRCIGLLATLSELPADRLVFLSASAVGNVGLSHDPISFTGPGLMILCGGNDPRTRGAVAHAMVGALTTEDADVGI